MQINIGQIVEWVSDPKEGRWYLTVSAPEDEIVECLAQVDEGATDACSVAVQYSDSTATNDAESRSCFFDVRRVLTLPVSQMTQTTVSPLSEAVDVILRAIVKHSVTRYYKARHAKPHNQPFRAGDRVPYAGRVFDEREMLSLTDATLDFWLTAGRFTESFERSFAEKLGVRFSALVNSGSSANLLAFSSLTSPLLGADRIVAGDEVITVAAGFPTTVTPIIQNNCVPVFLDATVEDGTYNIDVSKLAEAVSDRTRAVMVAHTLGNPIDLSAVTEFCAKHDLWLVEDNCDALGSRYKGQLTGTFGDLATSSFYPPHHMTMGEGGAVYSKSLKLKRIVESFRDWGRDCWCAAGKDNTCGKRFSHKLGTLPEGYDHKYIYRHLGYNLKASDMQAAIGCVQLEKLDGFVEARRRNWLMLREGLNELKHLFVLPEATTHAEPSWFGFALTVRDDAGFSRNDIVQYLESNNIQTRMLFAGNILRHPLFDDLRASGRGYRSVGELENSDRILRSTFWLGVYPGLSIGAIDFVLQTIRDYVTGSAR
jgi:CDP-6-deoxy-D-xylo-4-hexulose-3-dehydrase